MNWQAALAVGLIAFCVSPVMAWVAVGGSVARCSEDVDRVTIHFSGTLAEIADELQSQHDIFVTFGPSLRERNVSLDLENATLTEVVAAICKQTGCVYHAWGLISRPSFTLRQGDMDVDARPQTVVGDYRLLVEQVRFEKHAGVDFRWGEPKPDRYKSEHMILRVSAQARNCSAGVQVFGLSGAAAVITDAGETLETTGSQRSVVQELYAYSAAHLPLRQPARKAAAIKEFKGKLVLYSQVTPVSCRFGRDEVGVTKQLGGSACTLVGWQEVGDEIHVKIERVRLPNKTRYGRLLVQLKGPDGQVAVSRGYGANGNGKMYTLTWQYRKPEGWEPVALTLDGYLCFEPLKYVEFTIRNIPLP